jgi:hypothetical protein
LLIFFRLLAIGYRLSAFGFFGERGFRLLAVGYPLQASGFFGRRGFGLRTAYRLRSLKRTAESGQRTADSL